jgi:hypothetical protein
MITTRNFWLWFGGIWLSVGAVFLAAGGAIALSRSSLEDRFATESRTAAGTVLTKEIVSSSDRATSYRVEFRFESDQGVTVRGSAKLDATAWDELIEQGPIEVVYLASSPQTFRVPGQRGSTLVLSWVILLVGAVLAGVGGFLLLRALHLRRVERTGVVTAAIVTEVAPGNVHINGVPQWRLRYRFRDGKGEQREGSCHLRADQAQRWRAGSEGRVRYDPARPRSNVWIGDG